MKKKKKIGESANDVCNLDIKHKLMTNTLNEKKNNLINIENEINLINNKIENINVNNLDNMIERAELLDNLDELKYKYDNIKSNYDEIEYYNNVGDIIFNYYEIKNNKNNDLKEKKDILEFLSSNENICNNIDIFSTKNILLDKYYKRIYGINKNNFNNYTKYCNECNIEKIFNTQESTYICTICGNSENIIIDDDKQQKDYSPYRRLNHFREWLNQFQAKQTPDIPEQVFIDIVRELNKNRITDLSLLNRTNIKTILKKIQYNNYYEHISYIINKLNNLPPPKITRDMEKIFISMFIQIQEPWEKYKNSKRKNFLSYSYTIHKFCQLLKLDHLLDFFPLLKDSEKIMEGDNIWCKICKDLNWEFISSFK